MKWDTKITPSRRNQNKLLPRIRSVNLLQHFIQYFFNHQVPSPSVTDNFYCIYQLLIIKL